MPNKLYTPADANTGATPNAITVVRAQQIAAGTVADKLRWDPLNPLTPGYDPVPVHITSIAGTMATFSIVDAATGTPTSDVFTIDIDDRRLCHHWLPSTPRTNLGGAKRVVVLMICSTYHQNPNTLSDQSRTFKGVAKTASVDLTATGKWPRTEAATIVDAIIDTLRKGKAVDLKLVRSLFKKARKNAPDMFIPPGLGPL